MWVPPAKLKAFCKLDLRYWPCCLKYIQLFGTVLVITILFPLKGTRSEEVGHATINTPSKNLSNHNLLGQDGHDKKSHGINKLASSTVATTDKANTRADVVSDNDGNVRPMTDKERLRTKLLNTNPPYDK